MVTPATHNLRTTNVTNVDGKTYVYSFHFHAKIYKHKTLFL